VPSGLAVIVMDQIGRFFLDRMVGEEATGIFSAGYKLGMFMGLVVAAFRFAWHPFFLSTSKQDDAPGIFARVLTYFIGVTGFFFLVISFFIEEIVHFQIAGAGILGEDFIAGTVIVPIIMLAYIGFGVYANFVVGIYLKRKTIYLPFVTCVGALVVVLVNLILIPRYGIMGAAWATFLAYYAMAATLYFVSRRLYYIPYEIGRIMKLILVYAVLFFLGYNVLADASILYRLFLLVSVYPLLRVIGFFHADEKSAIRRFVRRVPKSGE
jgi:O-antigen/teichoic acid export membrane protein